MKIVHKPGYFPIHHSNGIIIFVSMGQNRFTSVSSILSVHVFKYVVIIF